MEWQDKAEIEGGIGRLLEAQEQMKTLKANIEAEQGALEALLYKHNLPSYQMELNDQVITISIKHSSTNKLNKERLAKEIQLESDTALEPKELKTTRLIDLAAAGKMSTETYEKCFESHPKEQFKLGKKQAKKKKASKKEK